MFKELPAIAVFDAEFYNSLTVWRDNNKEYFRAIDVCRVLRLSNPCQALSRNVDDNYIVQIDDGTNRAGKTNYLTEAGLYQLIFSTKNEWCRRFQKWVYETVLTKTA